jgi:hypothetical protein
MGSTIKIHTHPILERQLGVPDGHVIIDAELFLELLRKFGDELPREENHYGFKDNA